MLLAVIYHFYGADPVPYHLVNISIHMLTALAVYLFLLELTERRIIAFASALIFAVHPIQTDAVTYISGMRDTLSTFFYALGMFWFLRYRRRGAYWALAAAMACYGLGSLTKEMAATMVFVFILYDFIQAHPSGPPNSLRGRLRDLFGTARTIIAANKYLYGGLLASFCVITYYYLFLRHSTVRVRLDGVDWYGGSMVLDYLSIPKIILYYFKQILWPAHLLVDYKFFPILAKSVTEPAAILAAVAVALLILLAVYLIRVNKVVSFGILWFFVTLAPALNILPHHEFMAEHYLYLPMVGCALIGGSLLASVADRAPSGKMRTAVWIVFAMLIAGYSIRTVIRNRDWQNDLVIVTAQLKIRPNSSRTLMELGFLYNHMNLVDSARELLEKSLRITPGYGPTLNNLAITYIKSGDYEKAMDYFRLASESKIHPALKGRQNLAATFMALGQNKEGMDMFRAILDHEPDNREALIGLSQAHYYNGEYELAAEYLRRNLRNRPVDTESYFLLAEIYRKNFKFESAGKIYDNILEIEPENTKARQLKGSVVEDGIKLERLEKLRERGRRTPEGTLQLADLYLQVQEPDAAVSHLKEALAVYPGRPDLWKKYAQVLFGQHRFDETLEAAQKAVALDPEDDESRFLLARSQAIHLDFHSADSEIRRIKNPGGDLPGLKDLKTLIRDLGPKEDKARELLSRNGMDPDAQWLRAEIYISLGLVDQAIRQYQSILSRDPSNRKAKFLLARMYVRRNSPVDGQDAIRLLDSILEKNPDDVDAHNLMAAIGLIRLENYEWSYKHLEASLKADPDQDDADRLRRTADALESYIHAVKVDDVYLLPFVVDEKPFEKWLMPAATAS
jgi:protein O-mannosyl-transferase